MGVFLSTSHFLHCCPHKIFTWPSIMDCDLIEAECSHLAPSVNSTGFKEAGFSVIFVSERKKKLKVAVFHTSFISLLLLLRASLGCIVLFLVFAQLGKKKKSDEKQNTMSKSYS